LCSPLCIILHLFLKSFSDAKMPTLPERSQVVPGAPSTHFRGVQHLNAVLPNSHPQFFSQAEHNEGDGGQGTKSTYAFPNLHPHDGGTLTVNTVMEVYDEATHTFVMSVQGDPRFTHVRFTVRFLPGPTPDTSTLKWFCEYTPVDANSPGPEDMMDIVPQVYDSFAPHVEEHLAKQQAA
jgi:hypothetical protein